MKHVTAVLEVLEAVLLFSSTVLLIIAFILGILGEPNLGDDVGGGSFIRLVILGASIANGAVAAVLTISISALRHRDTSQRRTAPLWSIYLALTFGMAVAWVVR